MSSAPNITIYHDQVINQFFDLGFNYFQRQLYNTFFYKEKKKKKKKNDIERESNKSGPSICRTNQISLPPSLSGSIN